MEHRYCRKQEYTTLKDNEFFLADHDQFTFQLVKFKCFFNFNLFILVFNL